MGIAPKPSNLSAKIPKTNKRCPHGRANKALCPDCGGSAICVHRKQQYFCRECKGGAFCVHGRQKRVCADCGGNGLCKHGKIRFTCRECGGNGRCSHGRVRSNCRECGSGAAFCVHNRLKQQCRECGGSSFCIHGKQRSICKECGGTQICPHGRQRHCCKDCDGGAYCEHGRRRSQCKECGGASICIHNRIASRCRECGGASFCVHGKLRTRCRECGGGNLCEHDKIRDSCRHCSPETILCQAPTTCATYNVEHRGRLVARVDGVNYCGFCLRGHFPDHPRASRETKERKEHLVMDELRRRIPELEDLFTTFDRRIEGGCSLRRPDLFIDVLVFVLLVEIDEDQHKNRSCEEKRIGELFEDGGSRPLVVVRFNPDAYFDGEDDYKGIFKQRTMERRPEFDPAMDLLEGRVRHYMDMAKRGEFPGKEWTVELLRYDHDAAQVGEHVKD